MNRKNKEYTVLLLRPSDISDDPYDPVDSLWHDQVKAPTPSLAVFLARRRAAKADGREDGDSKDYTVLFVCEGFVKNLTHKVKA